MSQNKTETKSLIPRMTKFGKWAVLILLAFILIWPLSIGLYWTVYKAYTIVDPTRFPELDASVTALLKKRQQIHPHPKKVRRCLQPSETGWNRRWTPPLAGLSMI